MIIVFWLVPVIASALLIWILSMILSPSSKDVSLGRSIIAALVLGLVNALLYYFLRPEIGNIFAAVAFVVNAVVVCAVTRLSLLRSCLLLVLYYVVVGLLLYFLAASHRIFI